jgi:transcriptional regulator with XRE-family HTH domain
MSEDYAAARRLLARNLARLRKQRGWTQDEAAKICGMDPTHYGNLEREKHNATLLTLSRLARGFEVELCDLLTEEKRQR